MDELTLRKVQLAQLEILKSFRDICVAHDIKYILSSGTLLGSIRHNGFIPWDDDIDIDMPRDQYDLFLRYADELGEEYCVQNWYNDNEYAMPFSKIRIKDTVYQEENCALLKNNGIYIDVFPCDRFCAKKNNALRFALMNCIRLALILKSRAYEPYRRKIGLKAKIIGKVFGVFPREILIKIYEGLARKDEAGIKEYKYFENGGASRIGSWIISKECFEQRTLHRFEDDEFSIPQNYDEYLSSVYGDYMVLPPEDKRNNRHEIIQVRFGREK